MTSIITEIEDAFAGVETWLTKAEATASSIVSSVTADIEYLISAAPAAEKWFSAQIQNVYNVAQNVLALALSVVENVSPTISNIITLAKAAITAIEALFETTGFQKFGGQATP